MSETEAKDLRNEIKKYVDAADERMLRIVFSMFEADAEKDWWDDLPEEVKASVDEGIEDIDQGRFITHEEFMKRQGL